MLVARIPIEASKVALAGDTTVMPLPTVRFVTTCPGIRPSKSSCTRTPPQDVDGNAKLILLRPPGTANGLRSAPSTSNRPLLVIVGLGGCGFENTVGCGVPIATGAGGFVWPPRSGDVGTLGALDNDLEAYSSVCARFATPAGC